MIRHAELDGPFIIGTNDNRWNTTPSFFSSNIELLKNYLITSNTLRRVWAGDDPSNPTQTIALVFPDTETAETVLLSCGAIDLQDN